MQKQYLLRETRLTALDLQTRCVRSIRDVTTAIRHCHAAVIHGHTASRLQTAGADRLTRVVHSHAPSDLQATGTDRVTTCVDTQTS